MLPYAIATTNDVGHAVTLGSDAHSEFIAGGTCVVDYQRIGVDREDTLVDISTLPLATMDLRADGSLRVGALVTNSALAYHVAVGERFPVLREAILAGASPQIRNMATTGGNLLQRSRCPYFRDLASYCNKREPGSGCAAQDGYNRTHAILGGSSRCISTHPSDMCVALLALDAVVHTQSASGARAIAMADFHVVPGEHPEIETALRKGELVTYVDVPATRFAARSHYLKVRDRASFDFALASAAVALDLDGTTIRAARIALGGVATKPWRSV